MHLHLFLSTTEKTENVWVVYQLTFHYHFWLSFKYELG